MLQRLIQKQRERNNDETANLNLNLNLNLNTVVKTEKKIVEVTEASPKKENFKTEAAQVSEVQTKIKENI